MANLNRKQSIYKQFFSFAMFCNDLYFKTGLFECKNIQLRHISGWLVIPSNKFMQTFKAAKERETKCVF